MPVQPVFVLRQNCGEVESIDVKGPHGILASGDSNGWVTVWDLDRRRPLCSVQPSHCAPHAILKVDWIENQEGRLMIQSRGGHLQIMDIEKGDGKEPVMSLQTEYEGFCKMVMMEEKVVAIPSSSSPPSDVQIWNLGDMPSAQLHTLSPNEPEKCGSCTTMTHCGDGGSLFVGYESGVVAQWDLRKPTKPIQEFTCCASPINCIAIDSKGKNAIVGCCENFFVGLKLKSSKSMKKIEVPEDGIASAVVRDDRLLLATGGWDSKLRLWKYGTLQPLAVLHYHSKEITTLLFQQSENHKLLSSSRDGTIALWDIYPPHATS